jgi:hypothetical protein
MGHSFNPGAQMGDFYYPRSDRAYFGKWWQRERVALERLNVTLLPVAEANRLGMQELVSSSAAELKPFLSPEYSYLAFPFELDDDIEYEGSFLFHEMERIINLKISGIKHLASSDRDKCCVAKFETFALEILFTLAAGHLNTPFVLLDETKDVFFLLDLDFPIQIVGYRNGAFSDTEVTQWNGYLKSSWTVMRNTYIHYKNLIPIADKYYPFLRDIVGRASID